MRATAIVLACGVTFGLAAARADDPILDGLDRAKKVYEADLAQFHKDLEAHWTAREAAGRTAGNKAMVEQIKAEREAFADHGEYPFVLPPVLKAKQVAVRAKMEAGYAAAIKGYLKAKSDAEVDVMEKELAAFRKLPWQHLAIEEAAVKDDFLRLPLEKQVITKQEVSGPIEITATARTAAENIRLYGPNGSSVIFNWETNPRELRVTRPDGGEQLESGTKVAAKATPLRPNTWYRLRWRLTDDGMTVFVNDQIVFAEKKAYDLSAKARPSIGSATSLVDVRDFRVTPLTAGK